MQLKWQVRRDRALWRVVVDLEPCVNSSSSPLLSRLLLFTLPSFLTVCSGYRLDRLNIALKRDRQRSNEIPGSVKRREMIPNIASERFLRTRAGPAHPSVHVADAPGTKIENARILRQQDQIVDVAVTAGEIPFSKAAFRASFAGICADEIVGIDGQDDEIRCAGHEAADNVDKRLLEVSKSLAGGYENRVVCCLHLPIRGLCIRTRASGSSDARGGWLRSSSIAACRSAVSSGAVHHFAARPTSSRQSRSSWRILWPPCRRSSQAGRENAEEDFDRLAPARAMTS